jgi:virginiamycin B lyase
MRFGALFTVLLAALCYSVVPGGAQGREGGRGRGAEPVQLPDGAGKEVVTGTCGACHGLNMITGSPGFTQQGWRDLVGTMVRLPDAQLASATQYLATHFPPKPGREPKLIPGDVTVTFQEWVVPTLGQRSRDPLQLADGTIWWTGQFLSIVGRLNPRTGEMREYKLVPDARPHSIVNDAAGNIWYMGNGNGTIGKLNPATGDIQVYKMPDPNARDPHTGIFHSNGMLYFTMQGSNMVGRLNPANGETRVITLPTPRSNPYGIKENSKGTVFVAANGSNRIYSVDPNTLAVREYPVPDAETRIRRLAITSDDMVWYVNSALGRLGRLNPTTGDVKEWPSPSGPQSHPYAIEVIDDIIWYNESRQRPDALVRFDPRTERFQSWAIPSGVGIIRHMRKTPDGNLAIHQTSSNRIGLAIIGRQATTTSRR